MAETTLHLARALTEAWNAHDIDKIMSFYDEEFEGLDVSQATPQVGLQAVHQTAIRFLQAFPDLSLENEEMVLQDDRVAVVWNARGTHRGTWMNIPATNREVSVRGITVLKVKGGKVAQSISVWDLAGFLRAVRLLPELE